ncbi:hypothetical protein L5515_008772 [Caenorhabditis briggsae]|uniref:Uncharacterized protein n=1 Tax=Caenorhabditis briggsae TaxID=6238 RepID=A0AAE9F1W8_CAEBR|nr:hypothetical protein L5515_008772 [Caenorhabditis briggsae]
MKNDHMRGYLKEKFGLKIEECAYIGLVFWPSDKNGDVHPDPEAFIGCGVMWLILCTSFLSVFYFGYNCYRWISKQLGSMTNQSEASKSLQVQLFYALIVQAAIPCFLLYMPAATLFTCPMLNINLNLKYPFMGITIAIYPAIDPLPTILIIKSYRQGCVEILKSMEGSIHGLAEYRNFHYTFTFSTVLACLPSLYMPPTIAVMCKISLSFFTFDYFRISLPSTGIFTSWCASAQPNHFFKLIFLFTFFFNYCILLLPFFLSLIRVVILLRPRDHSYICPKIMAVLLPLLFLIPFGCTAFMIPAVGYCRTMGHPLKFGAVYIYYAEGLEGFSFQWRNSYIHLVMSVVMCILTLSCTTVMIFKLKVTKMDNNMSHQTKKGSTRAEKSLTITIIASMIPFVNNTVLTIVYLTLPEYVFYFIVVRPFGNDIETCIMPLILYLTHPMFKTFHRRNTFKNKTEKNIVIQKAILHTVIVGAAVFSISSVLSASLIAVTSNMKDPPLDPDTVSTYAVIPGLISYSCNFYVYYWRSTDFHNAFIKQLCCGKVLTTQDKVVSVMSVSNVSVSKQRATLL